MVNVALLTREYPPHVYGGAGVHVDYLSRELARRVEVRVRCFGERDGADSSLSRTGDAEHLVVEGFQPWAALAGPDPYRSALQTVSVDLVMAAGLRNTSFRMRA